LTIPVIDVEKWEEQDRIREVETEIFLNRLRNPSSTRIHESDTIYPAGAHLQQDSDISKTVSPLTEDERKAVDEHMCANFPPWNKALLMINCTLAPLFITYGLELWGHPISDTVPFLQWEMLSITLCLVMSMVCWKFTRRSVRPIWYIVSLPVE
jgi:hypothetical protein